MNPRGDATIPIQAKAFENPNKFNPNPSLDNL